MLEFESCKHGTVTINYYYGIYLIILIVINALQYYFYEIDITK